MRANPVPLSALGGWFALAGNLPPEPTRPSPPDLTRTWAELFPAVTPDLADRASTESFAYASDVESPPAGAFAAGWRFTVVDGGGLFSGGMREPVGQVHGSRLDRGDKYLDSSERAHHMFVGGRVDGLRVALDPGDGEREGRAVNAAARQEAQAGAGCRWRGARLRDRANSDGPTRFSCEHPEEVVAEAIEQLDRRFAQRAVVVTSQRVDELSLGHRTGRGVEHRDQQILVFGLERLERGGHRVGRIGQLAPDRIRGFDISGSVRSFRRAIRRRIRSGVKCGSPTISAPAPCNQSRSSWLSCAAFRVAEQDQRLLGHIESADIDEHPARGREALSAAPRRIRPSPAFSGAGRESRSANADRRARQDPFHF